MVRGLCVILAGLAFLQAVQVCAADGKDCATLEGKGASRSDKVPPPEDVDKLIECAGMAQDVTDLDRLDRDLLVIRTRYSTLAQWRDKKTDTSPSRKYSELASAQRLEKLKQLADGYYRSRQAK